MVQRIFKALGIVTVIVSLGIVSKNTSLAAENSPATTSSNPIVQFLKEIEYTSRLKFEHDTNILLEEDNPDSDSKEIFTQGLDYKLLKDNHYFQWGYVGNYDYFNEESTGVLSHAAKVLYSYRPFEKFSFGIGNNYYWLEDTSITRTVGDRVLALGYSETAPTAQIKYEINPQATFTTDLGYSNLDVRDRANDDYIDNHQFLASGQLDYGFTPKHDWVGFVGYQHGRIEFPQIAEKSARSTRPYLGVIKKFPGLFDLTYELGFEDINFDDNHDDRNLDHKVVFETIFSVYTKLQLSYLANYKNPSIRRQYSQYTSSIASVRLEHTINPKTGVNIGYTHEKQGFNSTDVLAGQTSEDKDASIHGLELGVERKLNNWLTLGLNYNFAKRDTDFAAEGYTDNKVSLGLTARY